MPKVILWAEGAEGAVPVRSGGSVAAPPPPASSSPGPPWRQSAQPAGVLVGIEKDRLEYLVGERGSASKCSAKCSGQDAGEGGQRLVRAVGRQLVRPQHVVRHHLGLAARI